MGFVDLHSHVLPGLDDGSPDLDSSLAMVRALRAVGFEQICATPHQKAAQFLPSQAAIDSAHGALGDALASAGIDVRLSLAAENFWDHVFFERQQDGSFPRYDGGRAFLFEIPPQEVPARFEESLFQITTRGYLPVMAHPERYGPFWKNLDRLEQIGRSCALVVDLGAVAGYHGFRVGRIARRLLADGIAHAAASDAHQPSDVRLAAEGIAWIKKKLGEKSVRAFLQDNPRCIVSGEMP